MGALIWTAGRGNDTSHWWDDCFPTPTTGRWLLVALSGYCLWYHLPLDSLPKAILIGLVPYLLVYSVVQRAVVALGWERGGVFNRSAPLVYLVLLAYWAYVAWKPAAGGDAGTRIGALLGQREPR